MRVLMIYIEPAPYILDLIRVLRREHPELRLRVLFISASVSQPWMSSLDDGVSELLSEGRFAALKQIFLEIRRGNFDWLHLAGWGHSLLFTALLMGATFKRRISMESDTQLPIGQGGWKNKVKELFYPRMFSLVDILFPGGTRQKEYFQYYGVPEAKIRIAQMTVDVTKIIELSTEIKERRAEIRESIRLKIDSVVFVFVGRLEEYKGVCLLLEAFARLPSPHVQLLIVGDGNCRGSVEQAVDSDQRIRYVGRRDFAGVVEAFTISDVAVVPSSFEPWGLVVNEAMAAGLPVIASNRVGCVDDLVRHGETGLVFPAQSVEELAGVMQTLADDCLLRARMGNEGRKLISRWRLEDEAAILSSAWQGIATS